MFTFIFLVILGSTIPGTFSLSWEPVLTTQQLPLGAAKVYPNTRKAHYFCRVLTQSGSYSYGHLTETSPECSYPGEGKMAETSSKFDILVKGREKLDWEYGSEPSHLAVSCELEQGGESDCYLGQGVYSDGICEEALGVIRPSKGNIYMTAYGRVETCPVYLFLNYQA